MKCARGKREAERRNGKEERKREIWQERERDKRIMKSIELERKN